MKSEGVICVLLLAYCRFSVQGVPTNILNFLYALNGNYDNSAQYKADSQTYAFTQFRAIPVDVPALSGSVTWYTEWVYDERVITMEISELTEPTVGVIHAVIHTFTNTSNYKFGEFNTDELSNLKPEDIQSYVGAEADFISVRVNVYEGTWPDVSTFINGEPVRYYDIITCDLFQIVLPPGSAPKTPSTPYILERTSERYPLIGAQDNFVSSCEKSNN